MFLNYPIYLIGLLPLALITGPLIPEIILIILSINFLYLTSKYKLYYYFKNYYFLIFIIFCLYITLNSLFTDEVLISLKSSFFYFRYGIYALAIFYFIEKNDKSTNICYWFYTWTLLILVIDSFVQIFFGFNLLGQIPPAKELNRISSFFGEELILGSFLQKIIPVYILLVIKKFKDHKFYLNLNFIFLAIIFLVIFRSGDRAAFGLIIIFLTIFFIIQRTLRKKILMVFFVMVIGVLALIVQNNNIYDRFFTQTFGQFVGKYYEEYSKKENPIYIFSFQHQSHYKTAMNMFLAKPISGHGVKMFRYKCNEFDTDYITENNIIKSYGCSTHPHNNYLQLLAETGIIGFLFLFSIFLIVLRILLKDLKNNSMPELNLSNVLLIAIFVNLWPIVPTGNFFNNWLSVLYLLPVSYYLNEKKILINKSF